MGDVGNRYVAMGIFFSRCAQNRFSLGPSPCRVFDIATKLEQILSLAFSGRCHFRTYCKRWRLSMSKKKDPFTRLATILRYRLSSLRMEEFAVLKAASDVKVFLNLN